IENALGDTGLLEQLSEENGAERYFLAWFQDEGIAAGQRERKHPQRDHRREIERRDADADAQRHIDGFAVDAARDVLQRITKQKRRDTAGVLDIFDATEERTACLDIGFTVLARNGLAEQIEI